MAGQAVPGPDVAEVRAARRELLAAQKAAVDVLAAACAAWGPGDEPVILALARIQDSGLRAEAVRLYETCSPVMDGLTYRRELDALHRERGSQEGSG